MSSNKLNAFEYHDSNVDSLFQKLREINLEDSYYLILLTGPYKKEKQNFIRKLSSETDRHITHIDTIDIVTMNEKETEKSIDSLFGNLSDDNNILFFSNGDRLCGAYAGFTYSKVRYATPQARYLMGKLNNIEKIVVIDIEEEDNVDKTLERFSHSQIRFQKPGSFFKRLTWKMGNVDFHGHSITSKRPA